MEMYLENKPSSAEVIVDADEMSATQLHYYRSIPVPPHRFISLKKAWREFYPHIIYQMGITVKVNLEEPRRVELKTTSHTPISIGNLLKCEICISAFMLGFAARDCIAALYTNNVQIDYIAIEDFRDESLPPRIKKVVYNKSSKVKRKIEDMTATRIVVANGKVYILGSKGSIIQTKRLLTGSLIPSPKPPAPMLLARL